MSAQPSPRTRPTPHATTRAGSRGVARSEGAQEGARARLTVAPEVARRRLRARLVMWGAALVTVASLFTLVAFHVFAAQSAFTLERLSKERTNEQLRYTRLRLQVAELSSAHTVIDASQKMGMVPGPGVITLSVPAAQLLHSPAASAGTSDPVATVPPASTGTDYDKTKRALGPTP